MSSLDHILQKATKAKKPHWCIDHQKWETEKHDTVEPFKNWVEKAPLRINPTTKREIYNPGGTDIHTERPYTPPKPKVDDPSNVVDHQGRPQPDVTKVPSTRDTSTNWRFGVRSPSARNTTTTLGEDTAGRGTYGRTAETSAAQSDARMQDFAADLRDSDTARLRRTSQKRRLDRAAQEHYDQLQGEGQFTNPQSPVTPPNRWERLKRTRAGRALNRDLVDSPRDVSFSKALWKSFGIQKEDSKDWEVPQNPKHDYMSGREYPDLSTLPPKTGTGTNPYTDPITDNEAPERTDQEYLDWKARNAFNRGFASPGWSIYPDSTMDWEEQTTGSLAPVADSYGVPHDQRRSAMLPEEQTPDIPFKRKVDPMYAFATGMHGGTTWDPFSHGDPKVGDPIDYRYGGVWGGEHGNPNWPLDLPTAEEYNEKKAPWEGDRTLPNYHRNSLDKALWKSLGGR